MPVPADYLDRVYAGVLGKLIGVYMGRPFEGWSYERILQTYGEIDRYVNAEAGVPLVVTDDDVAGTFVFVRALEDHPQGRDLSALEIGKSWLNYVVEGRSILWWGGNGISTEQTAWLNLKRGIPAPRSGSIEINGPVVAQQIGAQIFIDGFAMCAPGDPALAARLVGEAASVSHDGEAVHAARLIGAMEAQAFVCRDAQQLLDTGLSFVPPDSLIARVAHDVRSWAEAGDWRETRRRVEARYGYDRYGGGCHVIPNHALILLALLHAEGDFRRALMIINTCGWDTDCNAGNVGALMGIMVGLQGIDASPDLRGELADRLLASSADGGYAVNDAAAVACRIANIGRGLSGEQALPPPKNGAQHHFSLPGSVQGYRAQSSAGAAALANTLDPASGERWLTLSLSGAKDAQATSPVFAPPGIASMPGSYLLMATPRVSSGQRLWAEAQASETNVGPLGVRLRLLVYNGQDELAPLDGPATTLAPGERTRFEWRVPDTEGQPIGEVGIAVHSATGGGAVRLHSLGWSGAPELRLRRPTAGGSFWTRGWVTSLSSFNRFPHFPESFRISQDRGEGLLLHGTREWTDYAIAAEITPHLARRVGLVIRAQGLSRFYAVVFGSDAKVRLVRAYDGIETVLAEADLHWELEHAYSVRLEADGRALSARIGGVSLEAVDRDDIALLDGAAGLLLADGCLSTDEIRMEATARS
jgi:ADP-ribosylglycohydrolase